MQRKRSLTAFPFSLAAGPLGGGAALADLVHQVGYPPFVRLAALAGWMAILSPA